MSNMCNVCGGEIKFRHLDGRVTPIHLSGGCSSVFAASRATAVSKDPTGVSDDFCRPTTCPRCGASVFFIRHNGGSVWIDDLGWPWPKHGCFDTTPAVASARNALSIAIPDGARSADVILGVVVWAELVSPTETALIIKRQERATFRYRVGGNRLALVGELVTIAPRRSVLASSVAGHELVSVIRIEVLLPNNAFQPTPSRRALGAAGRGRHADKRTR